MDKSNDNAANSCTPFLKWPGGKRWLAPLLSRILGPELIGTYYEPFTGAASVFLNLCPVQSLLSDTNGQLIEALLTIREFPSEVVDSVWRFSNTVECYYRVRASSPRTAIGRAARFLYLNRTCWGGVYRLNRQGEFNVPFGDSGRRLCSRSQVQGVALRLNTAEIVVSDFEPIMAQAVKGDVVYADPPYTTCGENNGFIRYNESLFRWQDQMRLATASRAARNRGVFVAVTGLYHRDVLSLYPGWWVLKVGRSSCVSREKKGRRRIHEALVVSRRPRCGVELDGMRLSRIESIRDIE
jgi:DNA adenine methylase